MSFYAPDLVGNPQSENSPAIYKGQRSSSGESTGIFTLCARAICSSHGDELPRFPENVVEVCRGRIGKS
jgi:hypothetical protein